MQHILEVYPVWMDKCHVLEKIGRDLSLSSVVNAILDSKRTVISFCELIMLQKETAGRGRERVGVKPPPQSLASPSPFLGTMGRGLRYFDPFHTGHGNRGVCCFVSTRYASPGMGR